MRHALALMLALAAAPAAAEVDHVALAERALNQTILPGYERLVQAADGLAAEADAACSGDGPTDAAPVAAAYARTFDAWARIGFVRFGPTEEDSNGFAIAFWSDTRGSTPKALAAMMAAEDPVIDDPARFHSVSVAARGLMALDQLLFDPKAEPIAAGSCRCRLLVAIARDIAATAERMLARWRDPWAGILRSAGEPGNPVYFAPEEATEALHSALTEGLQATVDLRLGRPLGTFESRSRAAPKLGAPGDRCRTSPPRSKGCATSPSPSSPRRSARRRAPSRRASRPRSPPPTQRRFRVEALQSAVRRVQPEVASHVGPAVGVTSGFNAMDGD